MWRRRRVMRRMAWRPTYWIFIVIIVIILCVLAWIFRARLMWWR
jgi:hypothetical protein